MKKILIILAFFILWSCATPENKTIEKETTLKEIPSDATNVSIINKKAFPYTPTITQRINNFLPQGSLFAGLGNGYVDVDPLQVITDEAGGKLYWENCHTVTNTTHNLDLSSIVGLGAYEVRLYVKIVGYGELVGVVGYSDGSQTPAKILFQEQPGNFEYKELSQIYGNPYKCIDVITDSTGHVNMRFMVTNPYDAITIGAEPGVHIYQWIDVEIWVYAKWDVTVADGAAF